MRNTHCKINIPPPMDREIEFLCFKIVLFLYTKNQLALPLFPPKKTSQQIYKREQNRLLNALGFHAVESFSTPFEGCKPGRARQRFFESISLLNETTPAYTAPIKWNMCRPLCIIRFHTFCCSRPGLRVEANACHACPHGTVSVHSVKRCAASSEQADRPQRLLYVLLEYACVFSVVACLFVENNVYIYINYKLYGILYFLCYLILMKNFDDLKTCG